MSIMLSAYPAPGRTGQVLEAGTMFSGFGIYSEGVGVWNLEIRIKRN